MPEARGDPRTRGRRGPQGPSRIPGADAYQGLQGPPVPQGAQGVHVGHAQVTNFGRLTFWGGGGVSEYIKSI